MSSFAKSPLKPDFAYPKDVKTVASSDLRKALRSNDGPAVVDALIRYSIAETKISPDANVIDKMRQAQGEISDSVTKGVIALLMADAQPDEIDAYDVWTEYGDIFKYVPISEWRDVVTAQYQYFPSLYHFAAAQAADGKHEEDVARAMMQFTQADPVASIYWRIIGNDNASDLLRSADEINDLPESVYLILEAGERANRVDDRKLVYAAARSWLQRFPSSPYRDDIEQKLLPYLCREEVELSADNLYMRGDVMQLRVHSVSASRLDVNWQNTSAATGEKGKRSIELAGRGVFTSDTVVEIPLQQYGVYEVCVSTPNITGKRKAEMEVRVTDIMLQRRAFGSEGDVYAVSALNGRQLDDVTLSRNDYRWTAARGGDRWTPALWSGNGHNTDQRAHLHANILTDRSIYRPGDKLRFAVVAVDADWRKSQPVETSDMEVVLRDANWQPVDTIKCETDLTGRAAGEFSLPKDCLAGTFRIEVRRHNCLLGIQMVTVADYKAPTFEVKAQGERVGESGVNVVGTAIGYNGFPIAGATVSVKILTLPRWSWWYNFCLVPAQTVAEIECVTDEGGNYSVDMSGVPEDVPLRAEVVVGSPTGETRQTSAFVASRPYLIEAQIPSCFTPGSLPEIRVVDHLGYASNVPFVVEINGEQGIIVPDRDWSNVPSGRYTLKVRTEEPAFAFPFESEMFCFYRRDDKIPPAQMSLFVPVRSVNVGDKLLVGTSYDDQYILCTICDGDKVISSKWLPVNAGNRWLDIDLPQGVDNAVMTLTTMRRFANESVDVKISRANVARSLRVEFVSLRDRTVPGERERWTIKVTDNLGKTAATPVVLDVYSKALDALMPHALRYNPFYSHGYRFNVETYWYGAEHGWGSSGQRFDNPLSISSPLFNLYGQYWPSSHRVYYGMKRAMANGAMMESAMTTDDCAMDLELALPAAGALKEVGEECIEDTMDDEDAGAGASPQVNLRMPDVAVALWQPMLTTDADGQLHIEFEAPDANTTWRVLCMAFDHKSLYGNAEAEIVASKPLMVQPQWPRFARVGDRLVLSAMVMNASDSLVSAHSCIELFDPVTSAVISKHGFTDDIEAGASAVISLPVEIGDITMLGVKITSSAGVYTDGEQNVIAILPSVISQRSAAPFFFEPDSTEFSIELPKGSVVILTSNAIWECVTALPGIAALEGTDALTSVSVMFSAAVARGLLRDYPRIASALHRWESSDSILLSKLMKNDDLKIAMLQSTPWVGAAQSDTERMLRLKLLLDPAETTKAISRSIDNLVKLTRDGGLCWSSMGEKPSLWITETVLCQLAHLKQLGYLPTSAKLNRLIDNAIGYLDKQMAIELKDYNKFTDADYCMIRSVFQSKVMPSAGKRVQQNTVDYSIQNWRDMTLRGKSEAALLLDACGYGSSAKAIVESLRQYEAWRQTGLCAQLLDAFASIEPKSQDVDLIREDFIRQKQAMMWGDGLSCTNLIASMLRSGSDWLVPSANHLSLTVNGTELNVKSDEYLGEMRFDVPQGGLLECRKGKFPTWGGVFSQSTDSATAIKAFASDRVSITRRIEGEVKVGAKIKVILEIDAQDPIDFLLVKSPRCGGFEPVDQIPSRRWLGWQAVYCEPCSTETNWYFDRLLPGKTIVEESLFVTAVGTFILAPAELQSQYAPEFKAHTDGLMVTIKK